MTSRFLRTLCLALSLAGPLAQATPAPASPAPTVDGFTHVKSLDGIHEYKLNANGLTVLVVPQTHVPVVTYQVTYLVGSRNEVTGTTGATHLLEHLMFKGSKRFDKSSGNSIDQYLEAAGASFNATTSTDSTNYFATVGKPSLDGLVAIEADRMRNLLLRAEDLKSEMTVVRNEYEQAEDKPEQVLNREIMAAAFQAQPYHHPVIGWRSDIENTSVSDLRTFYDRFYWPNNATVTFVGNVTPQDALALVKKHYAAIPSSPHAILTLKTTEPEQEGPRRITVKRAGDTSVIQIVFKAPHALHQDIPALQVLGMVLSEGRNSRLNRQLVEKNLAMQANASVELMRDPGLFQTTAILAPGVPHARMEKLLWAELDRIKANGVTAAEIAQAIAPNRARRAYERDGSSNVASALSEAIAVGDWTTYVTGLSKLEAVKPADVQRVAKQYLVENRSTTGWFVHTPSNKP